MKFRELRADEIECRIAQVKGNGLMLLLYKDARCDMNLLDEVVGADKWQKKYELINGNLFCSVGIWSGDQWIWKQDVGTESNTEKEKGQASDAFKRACFNWGIGRELYTAPFIWVRAADCEIKGTKCYDKFFVSDIGYENGKITYLKITNDTLHTVVFETGKKQASPADDDAANAAMIQEVGSAKIDETKAKVIQAAFANAKKSFKAYMESIGISKLSDMTIAQFDAGMKFVGAE